MPQTPQQNRIGKFGSFLRFNMETCHIYFYNWTRAIFFTYLIILIFMFVVCVYKYMLVDTCIARASLLVYYNDKQKALHSNKVPTGH